MIFIPIHYKYFTLYFTFFVCFSTTWNSASAMAITVDSLPKLEIPKYNKRINELQDSLKINTKYFELFAWDQGVIDGDQIRITQFQVTNNEVVGSKLVCDLLLTKKKKSCKISLNKTTDTYFRMDALNMGSAPSHNSAFLKFSSGKKKSIKEYILNADSEKSALFKLVYDKNLTNPFQEFGLETAPQKTIKQTQAIHLKKNAKSLTIKNKCNGKLRAILMVDGAKMIEKKFRSKLTIPLKKNIDGNTDNLLKIFSIKKGNCAFSIKGEKEDFFVNLALNENLEYHIPIIKEFTKKSSDEIFEVQSTELKLALSDAGEQDGDIITVVQNGKEIISNYELKKTPKDYQVNLKPNSSNTFKFIPINDGKRATNTTLAVLYDGEKRIARFKLRSYSKKNPATLVLTHKLQ